MVVCQEGEANPKPAQQFKKEAFLGLGGEVKLVAARLDNKVALIGSAFVVLVASER